MRQLCNVAYALQVESLDKEGHRAFDIELALGPGDDRRVSPGATNLMALMRGGNRGR